VILGFGEGYSKFEISFIPFALAKLEMEKELISERIIGMGMSLKLHDLVNFI
jgi:hypothetical protein